MAKNVLFFKTGFHPPKQDGVARVPLQVNKVHQHVRGGNYDKKVTEWLHQHQDLIKLTGDNIDINQSALDQRKDNPEKSHHWILAMAFRNPVPSSQLSNENPICSSKDMPCPNSS